MSEPERFYIEAHYYRDITLGTSASNIETYEMWSKTYTRDWTPANNLSVSSTW